MEQAFLRTEQLLGRESLERLQRARVIVFGLGGVGSYAVEALVRTGIGTIGLVDFDCVSESNLNRQLIATQKTIGQKKTDAAAQRIAEIAPWVMVERYPICYDAARADAVDLAQYDYVIDAIDMVSSKLLLIERAGAAGVPIISAMGTGNKLDPTQLEVADITQTAVCPLARVMRRELKKRGIEGLKVVYSRETPHAVPAEERRPSGRPVPGSVAFVPSVAGLILAGEVVRDLIQ